MLRAWKEKDKSFPFIDSHQKNYNVRDGSDWEKTLKPRLHDRLNNSKNLILFLSSSTKNSRALREEIKFGVGELGLPVIVIYPEYRDKSDIVNCKSETITQQIQTLWDRLPAFRDAMKEVPTLHVPLKQELIKKALNDKDLMIGSKCDAGIYFYLC
nr:TIR domain-containing protein [Sulfobacillus harzensis]